MRIASVSDLHVDFAANRQALVQLATFIHRQKADAVVVAGDVSHVDDQIARALRAFRLAAPVVAYLPGNHDLWFAREDAAEDPDVDSWRRYTTELRDLVEAEDCHYLPAGPLALGSVALVGTTGWYDYSMLRPELRRTVSAEDVEAKQHGGAVWTDARFAVFRDVDGARMRDEQVARRMERELAAHLEDVDGNPEVRDVVVATHVLAFREALGPPKGMPWDFFDAFMGSTQLGEVIKSSKKVRACIFGHTHRPSAFEVDGIAVHGTPLGYPRERRHRQDQDVAQYAIGWIELPDAAHG